MVEWFDWTAYALLALYFSNQFFPEESEGLVALLGTFGIMAVGFVVRPVSGLLIGAIADHFGRKPPCCSRSGSWESPVWSSLLYQQIGVFAPIILLVARIVQGMCIGGEFSSM